MPRQARKESGTGIYHVMLRGINRQDIFEQKTGTVVSVHRHPTKDESFMLLRGKVKVSTYNDDDSVLESVVLCQEDGRNGVDIPKNVWHNLEAIEADSVIFECKEGPFSRLASSNERPKVERVEHEVEGILNVEKK